MATKLHGIVLRSKDRVALQRFYEALGLNFNEHQHGGPVHAECSDIDPEFVLEVYQASKSFPADALMLRVDSVADSLTAAQNAGGTVLRRFSEQGDIFFAYVADPDGRPVMLVQRK